MKTGTAIHVTGVVQGVGFRPWVWKTANRLGLTGSVCNRFDGVHIELFGDSAPFLAALSADPPPLARIDALSVRDIPYRKTEGFQILGSDGSGEPLLRISPDNSLCEACRRELFDPANRRYRHPFINCVDCGPRFSIIENLPYDRAQTTMAGFSLCPACRAEYTDPSNRRYHAQPIACPACGPRMEPENWAEVWQAAMEQGKIVAIKGIGGFHLACDALNPAAVASLRRRKGRETKPFALMVSSLNWVREVCRVSVEEERLLTSRERPIVLLKRFRSFETAEVLAPGLDTLGVMLPYAPLHELLFDCFPGPVVMTSANRSFEPMIHTNAAAREKLAGIADLFLTHDRDIANRCDDAVCAVHGGQTIVVRPGRGIAPVSMPFSSDACLLAFGADLKNSFALAHHGQLTLHPYIGDLENPETEALLGRSIVRQLACFKVAPECVVHDQHPDYFSSQLARAYARENGIPALAVQHHHAHLAGAHPGPAIGFAFDGTGYGTDGTIWGGEVFVYDTAGFERAFHLRSFALPGGDRAVLEPRRVADALLFQIDPSLLRNSPMRAVLASAINCPPTSGMGRLFDGVAALLGVCDHPTYDGEAAMRLEAAADPREAGDWAFELAGEEIDWRPMLRDLLDDQQKGVPVPLMAARFHNTLAEIVFCCGRSLAERHGTLPWVFAGGVFQNRLLAERIRAVAGDTFELVFSTYPNDSGLCIGQAVVGAKQWALR